MLLRVPYLVGIRNSLSKNLRSVSETIRGHSIECPLFFLDVFKQGLNTVRVDTPHRLAIDRAHRRLPDSVYGKNGRLDRAIAVVKFEARKRVELVATAL